MGPSGGSRSNREREKRGGSGLVQQGEPEGPERRIQRIHSSAHESGPKMVEGLE